MELNDYQQAALRTAAAKDKHNELFHLLLGLVGETGEIAEKAKKIVRDHHSDFSRWDLDDLTKELGDTLWYLAVIADHFGIPLEEVAERNITKRVTVSAAQEARDVGVFARRIQPMCTSHGPPRTTKACCGS